MTIDFSKLGQWQDRREAVGEWLDTDPLAVRDHVLDLERDLERALELNAAQEYVAVPVRWRVVRPGDVIVAKDGALLPVLGVERGGPWVLHLQNSDLRTSDPDRPVPILMSREERDALKLLRRGLGAVITER